MVSKVFYKGSASPCAFYNPKRQIRVVVHGDDFLSARPVPHLRWLREEINKLYEAKHQFLGCMDWASKEIKLLNRKITWSSARVHVEADSKHVEAIINELGLKHAKSISTPGVREYQEEHVRKNCREEERRRFGVDDDDGEYDDGRFKTNVGAQGVSQQDDSPLVGNAVKKYRSVVARINYLAMDRPDIQWARRECSKSMANPNNDDMVKLKRLGHT